MDEIYCKIIVSNPHVFASKQVNILVTIFKRCQLVKRCQIVKGGQIVTTKYAIPLLSPPPYADFARLGLMSDMMKVSWCLDLDQSVHSRWFGNNLAYL